MTAFEAADFVPPACAAGGWVWLVAVGVMGVGWGAEIVYAWLHARRLLAREAREESAMHEKAERPLAPGPSRVVSGRVEPDGAHDVAVEIDIEQEVKNHTSKNSRWHVWTEKTRDVRASAFYLVREDGESIYVEPDRGVLVADSIETRYPDDKPMRRLRVADVKRGEYYYAHGDLHRAAHPRARGGYRDGIGWVLRPSRRERMILATDAVAARYEGRAAFLRKHALWSAAFFVVLHAFFTLPFLSASLFGQRTTTHVVKTATYVTHNKNSTTTHYALDTRMADGFTMREDVPRDLYLAIGRRIASGASVDVPIVRTGDWEAATFLGEPYVTVFWLFFGPITLVVSLLIQSVAYRRAHAWYDQKILEEHGGSGHWVETRPGTPIDPSRS
jgi:hypothetical protein